MSLTERDQKHIWHPLTQHQIHSTFLPISKAKGVLLFDEDGNEYIDGISSWYTAMYGHCNDYIMEKVSTQLQSLDQVIFAGLTHEPAIQLSEHLIDILPDNQDKIFFSDNGSTANEIAIKMSLQYHYNKGIKKDTIIAFENGFHGDTFGAMSASGLSVYNGPFKEHLLKVERIATPNETNIELVLQNLNELIENNNVSCFIYEPLVQGANSMQMYKGEYLEQILEVCKVNNVICIADEVMTGFGKLGANFASDFISVKPDIISLSKALTAGVVPMAVTSCTLDIYNAFLSESNDSAFFHAHTYTANPIACSAAIAAIELLQSKAIQTNIQSIINAHHKFGEKIKTHSKVESIRQAGVIFALDLNIDMNRYGSKRDEIQKSFMKKGIYLRPLGKTIYIVPAFVISEAHLLKIYSSIETVLEEL